MREFVLTEFMAWIILLGKKNELIHTDEFLICFILGSIKNRANYMGKQRADYKKKRLCFSFYS